MQNKAENICKYFRTFCLSAPKHGLKPGSTVLERFYRLDLARWFLCVTAA